MLVSYILLISGGPGVAEIGLTIFPFLTLAWICTFVGKKKGTGKVYRVISVVLAAAHAVLLAACLYRYPSEREEEQMRDLAAERVTMEKIIQELGGHQKDGGE